MNKPANNISAPTPSPLLKLENELCKTAHLVEFIVCSLTRALETQEDEISLSYGEARALISLLEKVPQDIENAIEVAVGILADQKGGGAS